MAEISISDWCEKQKLMIGEETAKAATNVFMKMIDISPVNKMQSSPHRGRYMSNWVIAQSVGSIAQTEGKDPTKASTKAEIKAFLTPTYFLNNKSVVMYNTADYHISVETGLYWIKTGAYAPIMNTMRWAEQTNLFF